MNEGLNREATAQQRDAVDPGTQTRLHSPHYPVLGFSVVIAFFSSIVLAYQGVDRLEKRSTELAQLHYVVVLIAWLLLSAAFFCGAKSVVSSLWSYYYKAKDHKASDEHRAYRKWLKDEFGISNLPHPDRIVKAAQEKFGAAFAKWKKPFSLQ